MNKKIRERLLQELIEEQRKELEKEKKLAYSPSLSGSYKKGKRGIFVGNRIF